MSLFVKDCYRFLIEIACLWPHKHTNVRDKCWKWFGQGWLVETSLQGAADQYAAVSGDRLALAATETCSSVCRWKSPSAYSAKFSILVSTSYLQVRSLLQAFPYLFLW